MTEQPGRDFTEAYTKAFKRHHWWTSKWFWIGIIPGIIIGYALGELIKYLLTG
jgi:hypothetical protein